VTASRVVLWRHGRTAHNRAGVWQGRLDIPLDAEGLVQAEKSAAVLAEHVRDVQAAGDPVVLACSDLSRARDTAAALTRLTRLPAVQDARLREVDAGSWQGLTRAQIVAAGMGPDLDAWQRGEDIAVGGAEKRSEAGERAAEAVLEYARSLDGGLLVVAAHGGVIRGAVCTMLGLPPGEWDLLGSLGNCRWAVLGRRAAGLGAAADAPQLWRLEGWNVGGV
jgi:probable phosphoglycerate mutase